MIAGRIPQHQTPLQQQPMALAQGAGRERREDQHQTSKTVIIYHYPLPTGGLTATQSETSNIFYAGNSCSARSSKAFFLYHVSWPGLSSLMIKRNYGQTEPLLQQWSALRGTSGLFREEGGELARGWLTEHILETALLSWYRLVPAISYVTGGDTTLPPHRLALPGKSTLFSSHPPVTPGNSQSSGFYFDKNKSGLLRSVVVSEEYQPAAQWLSQEKPGQHFSAVLDTLFIINKQTF